MNSDRVIDWIERSKQRDTRAFRELVALHQPLVFRLAFRLLGCEEDAKDVAQDTFIRVWLHLHEYKSGFKFSTWISKIACNLCYDRLRAAKRLAGSENRNAGELIRDIPSSEDLEQQLINRELKDLIAAWTRDLTPKQKLVFTLRDLEELELDEIKKITGMSSAKIKSNLYLARQQIRNRINAFNH